MYNITARESSSAIIIRAWFPGENKHKLPNTYGLGIARLWSAPEGTASTPSKNNTDCISGKIPWNPFLYWPSWPSSVLNTPIPYFRGWWQASKTPLGDWEHKVRKDLILWSRTHVRIVLTSLQLWVQTSSHPSSNLGQCHRTGRRSLDPGWPRTAIS